MKVCYIKNPRSKWSEFSRRKNPKQNKVRPWFSSRTLKPPRVMGYKAENRYLVTKETDWEMVEAKIPRYTHFCMRWKEAIVQK